MVNKMVGGVIMSRRGDNIRKRKDGRWEGRYICMRDFNGKAIYRSIYGKTYNEVKEKLSHIDTFSQYIKNDSKETVHNITMNWLKDIKQHKKYSTYVKYENIYTKHIKLSFGQKRLDDITEEMCETFMNLKRGYGNSSSATELSNSTLSSIKNVLTQIIKYGTDNKTFKIGSGEKIRCSTKKTKEVQIFTKSEQKRMYEYLITDVDNYKLGILVCLFTGLRLGEICALKRENIDLVNRTIRISETVQRIRSTNQNRRTELIISTPKTTNSNRFVPICDTLYSLLSRYLSEKQYVINGSTVMEPRTYQYYFKKMIKTLSIEDKNFHCIRHTFATNCISSGMDVKCLSEILGHADIKTTLNKYVHPTMEQKINQINVLSYNYGQFNGQINENSLNY